MGRAACGRRAIDQGFFCHRPTHSGVVEARGASDEEFDPGSGRTLAACLMHASRTDHPLGGGEWRTAEEHVGMYHRVGDNVPKGVLSPHTLREKERGNPPAAQPATHQVVGGVTASQAGDG